MNIEEIERYYDLWLEDFIIKFSTKKAKISAVTLASVLHSLQVAVDELANAKETKESPKVTISSFVFENDGVELHARIFPCTRRPNSQYFEFTLAEAATYLKAISDAVTVIKGAIIAGKHIYKKLVPPLGDAELYIDDGIDSVQLLDECRKPLVTICREDFQYYAEKLLRKGMIVLEELRPHLLELTIKSFSDDPRKKWKFETDKKVFSASIKDEAFLKRVQNGDAYLRIGDRIKAMVSITEKYRIGCRKHWQTYVVEEVLDILPGE